jgi:hypothetical protein
MNRTEFILAATLVFILFCMAVVVGCMPGGWVELAAGGTAGGAEGRLTDVWIPLGTWLDIGGVRFKVVFEKEPLTELPVFTLIKPPSNIVATAKLALGEKELRGPDVTVTIKDYDFLTAKGITWGGRILCDISVTRKMNPSMSVYSPELSFYRGLLSTLESFKFLEYKVWTRIAIMPGTVAPPAFMAPLTTTLVFTGEAHPDLKKLAAERPQDIPVVVELMVDWFPEKYQPVPGLTREEANEMRVKRYQYRELRLYPGDKFKVVFELPNWYTPEAELYARARGTEQWQYVGSCKWEGVEYPTRVKIWDSWYENLNIQFSNIFQALNTYGEMFQKYTENVRAAFLGLEEKFEYEISLLENRTRELAQRVGERFRKHQEWTVEQLKAMEDWMITSLRNMTKPSVVVYAPQTAYAGVPNAFSVQPLNAIITGITVEDASGVLWSGISTFLTATPRVPGSGIKLKISYTGTVGEWAGKTFTKTVEIPFEYLTAVTWENQQPVAAPPPEPLIKAWHLLVVGGVVFAVVITIGLLRRRR